MPRSPTTPPQPVTWPGGRLAAVSFTFDLDAESPILWADPASAGRLSVMSHQAYGPLVGAPRLLGALERHGVRATFFVPGFSARRYPDLVRAVVAAGHEVAHHGYLHETLAGLDEAAERACLLAGLGALEEVAGVRPSGFRAPMGEATAATPRLLVEHGFAYDASLMDADWPYPLDSGVGTIVEVPWHWGQDDWEQYCYLPGLSGAGYIASPAVLMDLWRAEIDAAKAVGGCVTPIAHPFLSGRPARAAALEGLIADCAADPQLWVAPVEEVAAHVASLGLEPRRHGTPVPDGPVPPGDHAR